MSVNTNEEMFAVNADAYASSLDIDADGIGNLIAG